MGYPLGTKRKEKQLTTTQSFEKALMALDNICLEIISGQFTHGKDDTDRLYWQQKLKNIATPVSLALAEYRGPRVFHQHYTHDEAGNEIPVMESAHDNLIASCKRAMAECEALTGMKGSLLVEERGLLCKALKLVVANA